MIDPFGRAITYLRVSVTDRCDFRCVYCMSEDMAFLPKKDLLSLEELDRLCTVFIEKGVRKLRLTGGEPLVRKNVMHLVRQLSRHLRDGALDELTLTTNGSQLARYAAELADCGVRRINVSLDTRDPEKFRTITRWGDISRVMAGIDAAQAAAAGAFVAKGAWVSHVVLVEFVWLLASVYDLDAGALARAVEMLLAHKQLAFQEPETVGAALESFVLVVVHLEGADHDMPVLERLVLACEIGVVEAGHAVMIVHEVVIEFAVGVVPELVVRRNDRLVIVEHLQRLGLE